MKITLCFLSWNRKGILAKTLQSLRPTLDREDVVEWLILDNGSTNGTAQWLQQLAANYDKIHIYLAARNEGVAGGRDILFNRAQGDVIVSLDNDLIALDPDWLDRLVQPLEAPHIWLSGPGGHFVHPSWQHYIPLDPQRAQYADVCAGYCQAFHRAVLSEGVALDMAFNLRWHEDSDFCLQILNAGGAVWHTGDIGLEHIFSLTGDTGDGAEKQQYLASKWRGKGLIKAEREQMIRSLL